MYQCHSWWTGSLHGKVKGCKQVNRLAGTRAVKQPPADRLRLEQIKAVCKNQADGRLICVKVFADID